MTKGYKESNIPQIGGVWCGQLVLKNATGDQGPGITQLTSKLVPVVKDGVNGVG